MTIGSPIGRRPRQVTTRATTLVGTGQREPRVSHPIELDPITSAATRGSMPPAVMFGHRDRSSISSISSSVSSRFAAARIGATWTGERKPTGEHVRTVAHALQRPPDDRLGMAEAIGGGGVDPVDALLERAVDRSDRLIIVLRPPAELPASAADRPRAEPEPGDFQARLTELCRLKCCRVHRGSCHRG
jgi:hypothetical protein